MTARTRHKLPTLALAALLLALAGCAGTQVYPSLQEQPISLRPGELEAGGVAFITPSTVTGQEQEKQAVALTFSDVLKSERKNLRVVTLAETLGDTHRTKMLHGKAWNRANGFGQIVLAVAVLLLVVRIAGWVQPGSWADRVFPAALHHYKWTVDVFLAGVVGYGFYFWFSGRVWCRFMCPLAALMHVYARFSRFRIFAEKQKCISCGQCTATCHQGIDVMSFANRGLPMADPECVRCSACVHVCPTGVLSFGQLGRDGRIIALDALAASPVRMREGV